MKQLWRVSPSAVGSISGDEGCERKAAFKWVTPRGESTEKQQLGTDLHKVQQDYLNTGKLHDRMTRVGKMALAGLPYMPGPRTGRAEGESEIRISGINYVTIVDYEGPSDLLPGAPPGLPATLDHKTSSNPSQYGLWGDAAFLEDAQALTYAARALIKFPKADSVFLRWLYYNTQRKSVALPSDAVLKRADVVAAFGERVHTKAVRLIVLQNECPPRQAPEAERLAWANTVPSNTRACAAYGGCEYGRQGLCKLTRQEQISACLEGLDDAKIINTKPATAAVTAAQTVEAVNMSNPTDLFAALTAGLPVGGAKPANNAAAPKAPATPAAPKGGAMDALAALTAAASKGNAKGAIAPQLAAASKPDPINPPEKPEIVPPAKGADLVAHLESKGVKPASVPPKAAVKAPSVPPKAPATKAESKAKLDALVAAVAEDGSFSDEELGRALRVLARFVKRELL